MNYYSEEVHGPHEMFELGNFELESGITLPDARLAFKTQGTLNSAKDNAILFPHMWSGTSKSMEIFIGEDRPLDPSKYFIILPGQFANGFSSSPSNSPPPFNGGAFPNVTIGDDVRAQHRLLTERFGIERLEQHAESLAAAQRTTSKLKTKRRLDARLLDNDQALRTAYRATAEAVRAISGHGQACTAVRRYRQDHAARPPLRAGARERSEVRSGMGQRVLPEFVRRACRAPPARRDLVGHGTVPGFLQG